MYRSDHLRARAWTTYFWTLAPLLVFSTFTLVHVDRALLLALAAAVLGVSLRAVSVHVAGMHSLQSWCGWAVGPAGFLLLGLALPLERVAHGADDIGRAAGALALKFAGGPLALFVAGRAVGADVPHAFYLLAAMPCAFHLLVLAPRYD